MVEMDDGAVFPVVLFDGEREIDVGTVKVFPALDFKAFQVMLSQMIGISYNNLTTYFVDRKKPKFSPERRKILITGKVNFSVIVREKNCLFLVVLKRSRRERRRKLKQNVESYDFAEYLPEKSLSQSQSPENFLLLRRNQQPDLNDQRLFPVHGSSPYYNDLFRELQVQGENYTKMFVNSSSYGLDSDFGLDSFPRIEDSYPVAEKNRNLCGECTDAKRVGKPAPFHFCVYDSVVTGFRSPAGPISRPMKPPFPY